MANAKFHTMCVHTNTERDGREKNDNSRRVRLKSEESITAFHCYDTDFDRLGCACEKLSRNHFEPAKSLNKDEWVRFDTHLWCTDLCVHKTSLTGLMIMVMVDFCAFQPNKNRAQVNSINLVFTRTKMKVAQKWDFKQLIR